MASGKTHAMVNNVLWFVGLGGSAYLAYRLNPEAGIMLQSGLTAGLLMTPDLDHHNQTTQEEQRIENFFGAFLGPAVGKFIRKFYNLLWAPYWIFIPHRHFLSHGPIISTIIRAVYVWALLALIWWPWAEYIALWSRLNPIYLMIFLTGWALQDLAHIVLDL